MRTIERTDQFKKDYKRESKGQHRKTIEDDLKSIVSKLANDEPLAPKHRDHPLGSGKIIAIVTLSPI